jgi:AcrR family transcriptional regulator
MVQSTSVRRRARGVARIEQILAAAVIVFTRDGVERATTNAIAAEAGISPGSLYQFFSDKGQIAHVLGERYATELTSLHRAALSSVHCSTPLPEVLDLILDPIVAFKNTHPAFLALFARTDLPESVSEPVAAVDRDFADRISAILRDRNPGRSAIELRIVAEIMINLFRGIVGSLGVASGSPDADLAEVKLALLGYLECKGLR